MTEMTQVLRQRRDRPRKVGRMALPRTDQATATAESVESIARKLALAVDGQQDFQTSPEARVRQWDELIPGAEVSRLRYVAELTDESAPLARVLLP